MPIRGRRFTGHVQAQHDTNVELNSKGPNTNTITEFRHEAEDNDVTYVAKRTQNTPGGNDGSPEINGAKKNMLWCMYLHRAHEMK